MTTVEEMTKEVMERLGRHFVSLRGTYVYLDENGKWTGKPKGFNYSGIIFSIRGVWTFLTAGHILEELHQGLTKKQIDIITCTLIDFYGASARTRYPIPFVFKDAIKSYIFDDNEGLDFGLITLDPYYQRLIEVNGVQPVQEVNWIQQPKQFEIYFMMGLPEEVNPTAIDPSVSPEIRLVLMKVEKLAEAPPEMINTKQERFYGRLPRTKIKEIVGMSGGPIFGMGRDSQGIKKYWIVAIQSKFHRPTRTIAACPLPLIGKLVEEKLQAIESEGKNP